MTFPLYPRINTSEFGLILESFRYLAQNTAMVSSKNLLTVALLLLLAVFNTNGNVIDCLLNKCTVDEDCCSLFSKCGEIVVTEENGDEVKQLGCTLKDEEIGLDIDGEFAI